MVGLKVVQMVRLEVWRKRYHCRKREKCHTRWQPLSWVAQFVEKGVGTGLEWAQALEWSVPQELGHQVNRLWRGTVAEHFCPGMGFDLGKFEVRVIWVHRMNLFTCRRADYFDNFNELVNVGLARKDGCAEQHFSEHATEGPHVNRWGIIGRSEYEFRGTIVAAADVGDVGLAFDELLSAEKEVRKGKITADIGPGRLACRSRTT